MPHSRSSARTSYATLDRPTEPSRTAVFSSAKWEEWRTYLAELPRARNPRAAGAGQDGGIGGRVGGSCLGGAHLGHLGHAPPLADGRGPRLQRVAGGPPRGLPNLHAWGSGTRGPLPMVSTSAEAPGLVEAGAEDAALAAEDACRASLPACGSHRWAGAGAEPRRPVAPRIPRPQTPSKNSRPSGRLPGLLPSPAPCGP